MPLIVIARTKNKMYRIPLYAPAVEKPSIARHVLNEEGTLVNSGKSGHIGQ